MSATHHGDSQPEVMTDAERAVIEAAKVLRDHLTSLANVVTLFGEAIVAAYTPTIQAVAEALDALPSPEPAPTLPPEPGPYLDHRGEVVVIDADGEVQWAVSGSVLTLANAVERYGPFTRLEPRPDLAALLAAIRDHDTDYPARYGLILDALAAAHRAGYPAGIGYDHASGPDMDGYRPVVYIELPEGQISWHMPEHGVPFDGHTTEEKYARVEAYLKDRPVAPAADLVPATDLADAQALNAELAAALRAAQDWACGHWKHVLSPKIGAYPVDATLEDCENDEEA